MNEHKNIITIEDEIKEFSDKPVKSSALFKQFQKFGVPDSSSANVGDVLTKGDSGVEWKSSRKLYSHAICGAWTSSTNTRARGRITFLIVSDRATAYTADALRIYFLDNRGYLRDPYPASGYLLNDYNGIDCKCIIDSFKLTTQTGDTFNVIGCDIDFTNGTLGSGIHVVELQDLSQLHDEIHEI